MQKRGSTLTSSKFARRRRTRLRLFVLICILLAVLAFWGVVSLAQMRAVTISVINVQGNQVTPTADIQALVGRDLNRDYLWFFPASDAFLYPHAKIVADILATWPRISSVQVAREGFTGLRVIITEKQPVALWCGTEESGTMATAAATGLATAGQTSAISASSCYLMDDTGFIFAVEPQVMNSSASSSSVFPSNAAASYGGFIEFYGPLAEPTGKNGNVSSEETASSTDSNPANFSASPIGQSYLTPTEFANIEHFISVLQTGQGIQPQVLIAAGDQEGNQIQNTGQDYNPNAEQNPTEDLDQDDCELVLVGGSRILFNDQDDPTQVSANLQLFLANNNLVFIGEDAAATSTDLIDYIDLRYGTNIYYKTLGPASR